MSDKRKNSGKPDIPGNAAGYNGGGNGAPPTWTDVGGISYINAPQGNGYIYVPEGQAAPPGYMLVSYNGGGYDASTFAPIPSNPLMGPEEYAAALGATTAQQMEALLHYAPQLAAQQVGIDYAALPAEAMLSTLLGKYITPRQQAVEVANQQQFIPQYTQIMSDAESASRAAMMADVMKYAPMVSQAEQAALSPEELALQQALYSQILSDLAMGSNLTPEQQRQAEQASRSAQQARGINEGAGAANREAIYSGLSGQQLQQQRQNAAMGLYAQQNATQTNPFDAILSRPPTSATNAVTQYNKGIQTPQMPASFSAPYQTAQTTMSNAAQVTAAQAQAQAQAQAYQLMQLMYMKEGYVMPQQ